MHAMKQDLQKEAALFAAHVTNRKKKKKKVPRWVAGRKTALLRRLLIRGNRHAEHKMKRCFYFFVVLSVCLFTGNGPVLLVLTWYKAELLLLKGLRCLARLSNYRFQKFVQITKHPVKGRESKVRNNSVRNEETEAKFMLLKTVLPKPRAPWSTRGQVPELLEIFESSWPGMFHVTTSLNW